MMLRMKIWFTIFAIYEIVAIILLHCTRTCDAMFGTMFCNDHAFKYFIWCVAVPTLVFLMAMWIREIVMGGRRRRFFNRAGHAIHDAYDDVKERVIENVTPKDITGLISAAVLLGIKKLSEKYPDATGSLRRAMGDTSVADNDTPRSAQSRTTSIRRTTASHTSTSQSRRRK